MEGSRSQWLSSVHIWGPFKGCYSQKFTCEIEPIRPSTTFEHQLHKTVNETQFPPMWLNGRGNTSETGVGGRELKTATKFPELVDLLALCRVGPSGGR